MDRITDQKMFQILERLAEVFEGWLVDAFDFPSRCHDRSRGRNAIKDQTEIKLRFLSPPPLADALSWRSVGNGGGRHDVFLPISLVGRESILNHSGVEGFNGSMP